MELSDRLPEEECGVLRRWKDETSVVNKDVGVCAEGRVTRNSK